MKETTEEQENIEKKIKIVNMMKIEKKRIEERIEK